jgi:hypothetical protein
MKGEKGPAAGVEQRPLVTFKSHFTQLYYFAGSKARVFCPISPFHRHYPTYAFLLIFSYTSPHYPVILFNRANLNQFVDACFATTDKKKWNFEQQAIMFAPRSICSSVPGRLPIVSPLNGPIGVLFWFSPSQD